MNGFQLFVNLCPLCTIRAIYLVWTAQIKISFILCDMSGAIGYFHLDLAVDTRGLWEIYLFLSKIILYSSMVLLYSPLGWGILWKLDVDNVMPWENWATHKILARIILYEFCSRFMNSVSPPNSDEFIYFNYLSLLISLDLEIIKTLISCTFEIYMCVKTLTLSLEVLDLDYLFLVNRYKT